ncbi:hypothetical protein J8401_002835 [Lactiplantibacillus plantarum]|uniref:3-hydroxyacyl-ACP dehydratase FabZ family protein n=1 Tax=Lactiplantibacillus plantarum TaxID=1590 RepID=UPI001570E038|nr:hypothetical protein [Lactiplantibacillus plantarum]MBY7656485.1 hypothetical protein [Lactiplantibacillus plantarum]QKK58459.1 hypothetical protein HRW02_03250 [Lactiplantibacillus plantarum]QSE52163.1 hypothetical protein JWR93_13020 [Lactiplantibacillus plantarum]
MTNSRNIYDYLPQRVPFLFVDDIEQLTDESVITVFKFPKDWDVFYGHFPRYPIVPGTILTEAMAQAATILALHVHSQRGKLGMLVKISDAVFRNQVGPNDSIRVTGALRQQVTPFYTISVALETNNIKAATAELTIYVGDVNV